MDRTLDVTTDTLMTLFCCQNRLEKQQITEFGFRNPNPKAAQIRRSGCECYFRRCHWGHQKGSIPRTPRSTRNASWKRQDMVRSGSVNAPFRTSCFNFEYCLCVPVYPQVGSNYHTLDGEICQVPVVYHFLLAKKTSFPQLFPQRKHHLLVLLSLFKHSGRLITEWLKIRQFGVPRLVETRCRYTSNPPLIHLVADKYHAFFVVQSPHGVPRRIPGCPCRHISESHGTTQELPKSWWKSMILTYQMLDEQIVRTI